MSAATKQNVHGREMEIYSATEAKNSFGAVLDRVLAEGVVAITKRDKVHAVLLSEEEYEAMSRRAREPLERLRSEFDGLVERMQSPAAKEAGRRLFDAAGEDLGDAAVTAARERE